MDLTEIKHEFEYARQLQCSTCLSIGRHLTPLGKYTKIYLKLTSDYSYYYSDLPTIPMEICWECRSILRKILLFQEQVKKANELFLRKQNFTCGSLSSLASMTFNETQHKIYLHDIYMKTNTIPHIDNLDSIEDTISELNEDNSNKSNKHNFVIKNINREFTDIDSKNVEINNDLIQVNIEEPYTNIHTIDLNMVKETGHNVLPLSTPDIFKQDDDNHICNDKNYIKNNLNNYEETNVENISNIFYSKSTKLKDIKVVNSEMDSKKSKSRWAIKRAAQNRKPKFKIVSANFDEAYTKIQISNEELLKYEVKEKDSEYYKSKSYKCDICVLGFDDQKIYDTHSKKWHQKKISGYICDICNIQMSKKRHLSEHIAQHYYVYKCKICTYVCTKKQLGGWHLQNAHKKVFQCIKCDLKFGSRREFYKHYKDWHEKYICDHCGVSFKMRYCIKNHIRKQHSPFTCKICDKTFTKYNGLWLHNKLTHSHPTAPAFCVECNTTYKDVHRYKWHLLNSVKHTKKKKVKIPCPNCEKTFTKNIYMKDHFNLVHLKLYKYRCEGCDKNFTRNAELVKHRRRKHEGILPPKDKICNYCGRGFTTNKILRNHVRTHEKHITRIEET